MRLKRSENLSNESRTSKYVRIAVCGHRNYSHDPAINQSCKEIISAIQFAWPEKKYQVLSCLAEGADSFLAALLMEEISAELYVYLPLPEKEYINDFKDQSSIEIFQELKNKAKMIYDPDRLLIRPWVYRAANIRMLENSDLLFGLWDGLPARGIGGTGETIELARKKKLQIFWVNVSKLGSFGKINSERFD